MANITISNLHTASPERFLDSESYLNDIADEELDLTPRGGMVGAIVGAIVGYAIGYAIKTS